MGIWNPYGNCNLSGSYIAWQRSKPCSGHSNCFQANGNFAPTPPCPSGYECPCCYNTISTANTGGYIFGHGVGLCQRGAQGFANQGDNHLVILNKFYTGICVANSSSSSCSPQTTNDFCISPAPPLLNVSSTCNYTSGTTCGATQSYPSNCYPSITAYDVWYRFVSTCTNPEIRVQSGTNFDAVIEVFSGSCTGSYLGCLDSTNKGGLEVGTIQNANIGTTYFVRVYDYYQNSSSSLPNGTTFQICVKCVSCDLDLSSYSQSFSASGGNGSFHVNENSGCTWTASTNCNWVTINPTSGSGIQLINYTVSANTSSTSRTCQITVTGSGGTATYTITQSGIICTLSVSPSSQSLTASGGTGSFTVSVPSGCTWTATANCNWITFSPSSGTGNGSVTFIVTANPSTTQRICTITVSGQGGTQEFIITQNGETPCDYNLSTTSSNFTNVGGAGNFTITGNPGCTWSANSSQSWITLQATNGTAGQQVLFSVGQCQGLDRTGTITIVGSGGYIATHTVTQTCTTPACPTTTADFEASPTFGQAPLFVNFTDLSCCENSGTITKRKWNFFGNGVTPNESISPDPSGILFQFQGCYSVRLEIECNNGQSSANEFKQCFIEVGVVNNTNDFRMIASYSLFPNPSTGQCTVNLDLFQPKPVSIAVYNAIGQLVFEQKKDLLQAGKNILPLDMTSEPKGLYLVRIQVGEHTATEKLILQ